METRLEALIGKMRSAAGSSVGSPCYAKQAFALVLSSSWLTPPRGCDVMDS